jgi:predicted protein tyrosine phosphatase
LILVTSWNKFYFQCQFHVTNIQNIPDIFKYLKNNIINIKKRKVVQFLPQFKYLWLSLDQDL